MGGDRWSSVPGEGISSCSSGHHGHTHAAARKCDPGRPLCTRLPPAGECPLLVAQPASAGLATGMVERCLITGSRVIHRSHLRSGFDIQPLFLLSGQETAWRQLPPTAQHLGKRGFKRYLEPFIDPLFRSACVSITTTILLHSYVQTVERTEGRRFADGICTIWHRSIQSAMHQGCQNAAIDAAGFLRDWLGPRIFAGRLSHEQQQVMQQFVPADLSQTGSCFGVPPPKFGLSGAAPPLARAQ